MLMIVIMMFLYAGHSSKKFMNLVFLTKITSSYPHITGRETKALSDEVTCLRSCHIGVAELLFEHGWCSGRGCGLAWERASVF